MSDLEKWDSDVISLAKDHKLDWFPIRYEICDYYTMIGHMAYHGMPTHYGHWSFGKSFETTHQMYNAGATGLPYELIINSNPSIAYLMRENPLYLQVLIMAHCVGHSDFFKNNVTFSQTDPDNVVQSMRNAKKRIRSYVEDPSIGIENVENTITAAQAIQFQVCRTRLRPLTKDEQISKFIAGAEADGVALEEEWLSDEVVVDPDDDLLSFIISHSRNLPEWKRDILEIIHNESLYFIPQMQTKIMNEGWASFWHYRIMHALELTDDMHLPFLKSHNQVVRPHVGAINPYHLGFELFRRIEERHGLEECFIARESLNDNSFILSYLTQQDCEDLGLFSFSLKRKTGFLIDEISDKEGWKNIRRTLSRTVGTHGIPVMSVEHMGRDFVLHVRHEYDGRDLDLENAGKVVDHIKYLWGDEIKLYTEIEGEPWEF